MSKEQGRIVRCPGHPIHSGYQEYIDKVLELAGLPETIERSMYESWNPYQLQRTQESKS